MVAASLNHFFMPICQSFWDLIKLFVLWDWVLCFSYEFWRTLPDNFLSFVGILLLQFGRIVFLLLFEFQIGKLTHFCIDINYLWRICTFLFIWQGVISFNPLYICFLFVVSFFRLLFGTNKLISITLKVHLSWTPKFGW